MAVKQLQGRFSIKNEKMVQHKMFPVFPFPHKHADIQIYRSFTQQIETYVVRAILPSSKQ